MFLDRKRILAQPSCLDNNMAAFVLTDERVDISFVYFLLLTIRFSASRTRLPCQPSVVLRFPKSGSICLRSPNSAPSPPCCPTWTS